MPRRTRAEMVVRSLFIQATNNFERMMSLGFLFALWPLIRRKYTTPEGRREAALRHLSFFNTQPYLANCILGVVAHAELRGGPGLDIEVARVKKAMMGAFGALGDDLYWAGLMPAAALVTLVIAGVLPQYAIAGVIVGLIAYNVFHGWARIRLFEIGYRLGRRITTYLKLLRLPRLAQLVKTFVAFALGVLAVVVVWRAGAGAGWIGGVAAGVAVVVSVIIQSFGVRPGLSWYIIAAGAVTFGFFLT
ncbi:MAG: PTS system mannose/fructose/sorbose family transporter subunit IID [Candidatus Zixiibacteriota bacterium]